MKTWFQIPRTHMFCNPDMSVIPTLLQWDEGWTQKNPSNSVSLLYTEMSQTRWKPQTNTWGWPLISTHVPRHTHEQEHTSIHRDFKNYSRVPSMLKKTLDSIQYLKSKQTRQKARGQRHMYHIVSEPVQDSAVKIITNLDQNCEQK